MQLSNLNADKRTQAGFDKAVSIVGCEPEAFRAVMAVESRSRGYDRLGRLVALFEPHVFYRVLRKRAPGLLEAAVAQGLAYASWGERPYPGDSYPRIKAAMAIHEEYALQAVSWGLPQILGENHEAAGYDSAKEMVLDFLRAEDPQIIAMARFIDSNRLSGALKAKDWARFARGYNGAGYRKNRYDELLERAYRKEKSHKVTNDAIKTGAVVVAGGGAVSNVDTATGTATPESGASVVLWLVAGAVLFLFAKWREGSQSDEAPEVIDDMPPEESEPEDSYHEPPQITASPTAELDAARARFKAAMSELHNAAGEVNAARDRMRARLDELRKAEDAAMSEIDAVKEIIANPASVLEPVIELPPLTPKASKPAKGKENESAT